MTGSSSPCGACKFLRRKCVKGCVFAPYFSNEQGASQFAAIHKVFGASNASKLLGHLPVNDRSEAALTISYEAQARVHDPVYGCISHIFALQQQVINLQTQLAYLKQQAGQVPFHGPNSSTNPNWCPPSLGNSNLPHQTQPKFQVLNQTHLTHLMNMASMESSENSTSSGQNHANAPYSYAYHNETSSQALDEKDDRKWDSEDADDLRSVAFRQQCESVLSLVDAKVQAWNLLLANFVLLLFAPSWFNFIAPLVAAISMSISISQFTRKS